ncbi:MAG: Aspartate carbamoyltransferase, partial [uncultured Rubrobacteraceae bacterium]
PVVGRRGPRVGRRGALHPEAAEGADDGCSDTLRRGVRAVLRRGAAAPAGRDARHAPRARQPGRGDRRRRSARRRIPRPEPGRRRRPRPLRRPYRRERRRPAGCRV